MRHLTIFLEQNYTAMLLHTMLLPSWNVSSLNVLSLNVVSWKCRYDLECVDWFVLFLNVSSQNVWALNIASFNVCPAACSIHECFVAE